MLYIEMRGGSFYVDDTKSGYGKWNRYFATVGLPARPGLATHWSKVSREGSSIAKTSKDILLKSRRIQGSVLSVKSEYILRYIWKFQPSVQADINNRLNRLRMPAHYVGLHIRRGDKNSEAPFVPLSTYIALAEIHGNVVLPYVYVATDSYAVIEELRAMRPSWNFFFIISPNQTGHFQKTHNSQDFARRHESMMRLLVDTVALQRATTVICTFSSNVGRFLRLLRYPDGDRTISADQGFFLG
jgi:hypothetical protein